MGVTAGRRGKGTGKALARACFQWVQEQELLWLTEPLEPLAAAQDDDRQILRARWDVIEQRMRAYLAALQDETLGTRPIQEPEEDKDLLVWQVLLHVVNHGTDHRAQLLRSLHDLGLETASQDYIFYVYDHP